MTFRFTFSAFRSKLSVLRFLSGHLVDHIAQLLLALAVGFLTSRSLKEFLYIWFLIHFMIR